LRLTLSGIASKNSCIGPVAFRIIDTSERLMGYVTRARLPHDARKPGAQNLCYFLDTHRLADHMPLHFITTLRTQEFELLLCFDAFGDHSQAQIVTHRYDGRCNRLVVRLAGDVLNELPCDLQSIDRQMLQWLSDE
jgi:hypothetical protein